jgi:hypothetical protein
MKKRFKRLGLRFKHSLMLFTSRYYTVVTDDGHGDLCILHNCCATCSADRLDMALQILEQIEDEGDQVDALDLVNQIIANKN